MPIRSPWGTLLKGTTMTVGELKELLANYDDATIVKIWPFVGPASADGLAPGAFRQQEDGFPATLCLRPITKEAF